MCLPKAFKFVRVVLAINPTLEDAMKVQLISLKAFRTARSEASEKGVMWLNELRGVKTTYSARRRFEHFLHTQLTLIDTDEHARFKILGIGVRSRLTSFYHEDYDRLLASRDAEFYTCNIWYSWIEFTFEHVEFRTDGHRSITCTAANGTISKWESEASFFSEEINRLFIQRAIACLTKPTRTHV